MDSFSREVWEKMQTLRRRLAVARCEYRRLMSLDKASLSGQLALLEH
jgi:hypothetical protein